MSAPTTTTATTAAAAGSLPFTIVVNTCEPYASRTLPVLLESMAAAGVPRESVVVVCGQCGTAEPLASVAETEGMRRAHVPYTAEALTGLICVSETPELVPTPWLLYIQDTMAVGGAFVERALETHRAVSDAPDVWCVKLLDTFSLSVGFYRADWLRSLDLSRYKAEGVDLHGMRQIKTWCEDRVFDVCPPERARFLGRFHAPQDRAVVGGFQYSEGAAQRSIEHYPSLDVYKFKSWDGDVHRVGTYRAPDNTVRTAIPVGV